MVYLNIVCAVIASLLGFVFLCSLRRQKKASAHQNGNCLKSCENGTCDEAKMVESADIIVVGAGVVGSALAYTLGKDGRRVHVVERDLSEPDRIVELGLEDKQRNCVNEIDAQRVFGYALYKDGKSTKLPYPLENFHPDVAGRSFHHGRFIQRMREKASSLPNVRLEQGTVTSLLEEKGIVKGVQYKFKDVQEDVPTVRGRVCP
ncbi:hypothetical protein FF1_034969 [Malus domestica]